jgi:hypothetical protein
VGRQLHWLLQHDLLPVKMRGNCLHGPDITPFRARTQTQESAVIEQHFRCRQGLRFRVQGPGLR